MLHVEKISFELKGRKIIHHVSFQMRVGELLVILGANGAGKSTLLKLIAGELKPLSGNIKINEKSLSTFSVSELALSRAMLSQKNEMSISYSVSEIIAMGRYPHEQTSSIEHDQKVIEQVVELCGVHNLLDRAYLSLSGGEQQRVQLARVLAQIWDQPNSLLLLDEPIAALDLHYQQKILAIAKALSRRNFMVVMVLHDVNFAATYADRIIMLKNGRKLFDGTPIEVLNQQEMYTIYSVQSSIELNHKTLRPYVHLEEMLVDI